MCGSSKSSFQFNFIVLKFNSKIKLYLVRIKVNYYFLNVVFFKTIA